MQLGRFRIKAQEALAAAVQLAETRHNPQVAPAHLLDALLETSLPALRAETERALDEVPQLAQGSSTEGPRVRAVPRSGPSDDYSLS
jgi:hypothetical protein